MKEQEVALKMLEMAILETHIFKIVCRSMPPDPPTKFVPMALVVPPSFENPRSTPCNLGYKPRDIVITISVTL